MKLSRLVTCVSAPRINTCLAPAFHGGNQAGKEAWGIACHSSCRTCLSSGIVTGVCGGDELGTAARPRHI